MRFKLKKSNDGKHKFIAEDENGKKIKFGAVGYEDFTMHKDTQRKERYWNRHRKEDWSDLYKAGTWSRYLLWNKTTLRDSIKDMEERFNIQIEH